MPTPTNAVVVEIVNKIQNALIARAGSRIKAITANKEAVIESAKELEDSLAELPAKVDTAKTRDDLQAILVNIRHCVDDLASWLETVDSLLDKATVVIGLTSKADKDAIIIPTQAELDEQVRGLWKEFEHVTYKDGIVTVRTDPIVLEDCNLGKFDINVNLNFLSDSGKIPYKIRPASPDCYCTDGLSHPHVDSEGYLCEGTAYMAIANAIRTGRIYDLCLIIKNTLHNYNAGAPYISVEELVEGSPVCAICEGTMDSDSSGVCDICDATCCYDCLPYCNYDDVSICQNCIDNMAAGRNLRGRCRGCKGAGKSGCLIYQDVCADCGETCDTDLNCLIMPSKHICSECCVARVEAFEDGNIAGACCDKVGYHGCGLIRHNWPEIDSLNHPARAYQIGKKSHKHHNLGVHPITLFHKAQKEGNPHKDFDMYQKYRNSEEERGRAARLKLLASTS